MTDGPRPVAVVTGSSGGLGAAVVAVLRAQGLWVVGLDRVAPAEPTAPQTPDEHHLLDLGDLDAVAAVLPALQGRRVVALVNNAAVQDNLRLSDLDGATFLEVLTTNVVAAHLLTRGLADDLRAQGGAVVNISSVHALATTAAMGAYAASKAALVALTKVAAQELAPEVRVNAVLPGAVQTPMLEAGLARHPLSPEQARWALQGRTPLGRIGDPVDVARTVAFLLDSEQSGFVTGESLVVDGGVSARLSSE